MKESRELKIYLMTILVLLVLIILNFSAIFLGCTLPQKVFNCSSIVFAIIGAMYATVTHITALWTRKIILLLHIYGKSSFSEIEENNEQL